MREGMRSILGSRDFQLETEDLRKMRVAIESSCARLLEAIQNKSKESPKRGRLSGYDDLIGILFCS